MDTALVAAARGYLGAPFVHQGRLPAGMDCAGLLVLAYADCGRQLRDLSGYGRTPWRDGLEAALEDNFGPALPDGEKIEPGDKLLILGRSGEPQHIAIAGDYYLGGISLIHTRSDLFRGAERGRVTEHRLDERWAKLIFKVYR